MNEPRHNPDQHGAFGAPTGDGTHTKHKPYWQRAHRDWKFWVAVIAMLAAMVVYVMTDNLATRPHILP